MTARFAPKGKFLVPSFGGLGLSDRAHPEVRTQRFRHRHGRSPKSDPQSETTWHRLGWRPRTPTSADDQERGDEYDDDQEDDRCQPCNPVRDRKSTRLNSSHSQISYAVFCLKKKKDNRSHILRR